MLLRVGNPKVGGPFHPMILLPIFPSKKHINRGTIVQFEMDMHFVGYPHFWKSILLGIPILLGIQFCWVSQFCWKLSSSLLKMASAASGGCFVGELVRWSHVSRFKVPCFCSSLGKASSPNEKGLPGNLIYTYWLYIYICIFIYMYANTHIYINLIIFIHLDGSQIDMEAQS